MRETARDTADVASWYDDQAGQHERSAATAAREANSLSNARLATFGAIIVAAAWLIGTGATWRLLAAATTMAAVVLFLVLVRRHRAANDRWRHALALAALHRRGAARVRRDWAALPDVTDMAPSGHPYARDLDVMGPGPASMFALVDTISIYPGRPTLQRWLLAPATDASTIRERQRAVAELAGNTAFRHELALLAARTRTERAEYVRRFVEWAREPGALAGRSGLVLAARVVPVTILFLAILAARGAISWTMLLAPLLAAGTIIGLARSRVESAFGRAMVRATGLRHHAAMLELVERTPFSAPALIALRERITADGGAAERMRGLERLLTLAEVRYSAMLHGVLQLLLVWDVHVVVLLDRWRRVAGTRVADWLDTLGDIEALAALGTLAHDNPDWCYPAIGDEPRVVAEAIGHPLLPPATRVPNDVAIGPPGRLLVVTGSNMSGKSTLLRAIGLNTVLALAGAPVCARRFSLPLLDVWTCARVDDSLAEGVSLFMAELRRLQSIVEAARVPDRPRPLLYLLDEILHGTNTAERQIAARTILHHLLRSGAIGAVTTHDLTLAAEPSLERAAEFVHFTERFASDGAGLGMRFDYVLQPGLATSTNALRLLDMLGLGES